MNNQLTFSFEHQELLNKISQAKQNGDWLKAIYLAEQFYQQYPSLDNHYRIVEIYIAQQDFSKAWELLKQKQEDYCQSPVFYRQFVEIALKQNEFLLVRQIAYQEFLNEYQHQEILDLLSMAENYYQTFFATQLIEKKRNWQAMFSSNEIVFTTQWQVLCQHLTSQTLIEIMQEFLPHTHNQGMIARSVELMYRLHFDLTLPLQSCFGGSQTICIKDLTLPNEQPYWQQVLNVLTDHLADNDVSHYELLVQEIQLQMALAYPFQPLISPNSYAKLLIQKYDLLSFQIEIDKISEQEIDAFNYAQSFFASFYY